MPPPRLGFIYIYIFQIFVLFVPQWMDILSCGQLFRFFQSERKGSRGGMGKYLGSLVANGRSNSTIKGDTASWVFVLEHRLIFQCCFCNSSHQGSDDLVRLWAGVFPALILTAWKIFFPRKIPRRGQRTDSPSRYIFCFSSRPSPRTVARRPTKRRQGLVPVNGIPSTHRTIVQSARDHTVSFLKRKLSIPCRR